MERETGLEPATSSLGSWHSTTELLPHSGLSTVFGLLGRNRQHGMDENVLPARAIGHCLIASNYILPHKNSDDINSPPAEISGQPRATGKPRVANLLMSRGAGRARGLQRAGRERS